MNINKTDLTSIRKFFKKRKITNQLKKTTSKQTKKQPFNGFIKLNSKKVRIFMETFSSRTLSLNYSTLRVCTLHFNLIFHICKAEKSAKSGKEVVNVHEEE